MTKVQMKLDAEQTLAARHIKGPAIVLAGPGSGKTRVLVARIIYMIENGLSPDTHLVTTFSRKAAMEMRQRVSAALGDEQASRVPITTLHAFGFRVIRENPELFGRRPRMTLLDEKESFSLFRKVVSETVGDFDVEALEGVFALYGRYRNDGALLSGDRRDGVTDNLLAELSSSFLGFERGMKCLAAYEAVKQRQNLLDFDDLCVLPSHLLAQSEALGKRYAIRFPFLSMDESQDTNRVQFQMIESIAKWHRNIFIVGDDDQLIYEWRGARMSNLHGFINRFAPKRYYLERNYRSTPAIVEASVSHILHNDDRLPKRPRPAVNRSGDAPGFIPFSDHFRMVSALAAMIAKRIRQGVPPGEISVLYRINRIAYLIEPALKRQGIAYEVVGGVPFAKRQEISAALSAVRLLTNPKDVMALSTLAQYVPGLGKASVEQVVEIMRRREIGYDEVSERDGLKAAVARKMEDLRRRLCALDAMGAKRLGDWCQDSENGIDVLRRDKDPEVRERRVRNLELLQSEASGWEEYLEMVLDGDEEAPDASRVTLSTIHRAKGKEWRTVFVVGFSEGIMPSEKDDIEDARRVSYVALTRAKDECLLLHSDKIVWGKNQVKRYEPSRFLDEMGHASRPSCSDRDRTGLQRFRQRLKNAPQTQTQQPPRTRPGKLVL